MKRLFFITYIIGLVFLLSCETKTNPDDNIDYRPKKVETPKQTSKEKHKNELKKDIAELVGEVNELVEEVKDEINNTPEPGTIHYEVHFYGATGNVEIYQLGAQEPRRFGSWINFKLKNGEKMWLTGPVKVREIPTH